MSNEPRMNERLKKLESALQQLKPVTTALDRNEVLYQAGWAAAMANATKETETKPTKRLGGTEISNYGMLWPATTAISLTAAIVLGTLLLFQTNQFLDSNGSGQTLNAKRSLTQDTNSRFASKNAPSILPRKPRHTEVQSRRSRMIETIMNFSDGQIMKSGLAFQDVNLQIDSRSKKRWQTDEPRSYEMPTNQRQMMNELLDDRPPKKKTW